MYIILHICIWKFVDVRRDPLIAQGEWKLSYGTTAFVNTNIFSHESCLSCSCIEFATLLTKKTMLIFCKRQRIRIICRRILIFLLNKKSIMRNNCKNLQISIFKYFESCSIPKNLAKFCFFLIISWNNLFKIN